MKLEPRYYQTDAMECIIKYIVETDGKHPLVALPTGAGKSLVIAMLIEFCRREWDVNILILSHSEDILSQDYKAINNLIDEPVGLYSAGLDSRTILPVTVAGIQSAYTKPELFEYFDFVIIDEAHLINVKDETMYKKFLSKVGKIYCGLTGTPFRLGSGYIYGKTNETLFDDLVCDYTSIEKFNRLIDEGYLCRIKTISTELKLDTSDLNKRAGEFIDKEMSMKFDRDSITSAAVKEIIRVGKEQNCKRWIIFAINIEHAEHIAENFIQLGIPTGLVHSKAKNKQEVLTKHRNGTYTAIVNVNVLSTGYDDPAIDLIGMLRPTDSPVFHVQTAGRGLRVFPGKEFCAFLDFAGNTARLGPINAVKVHKKSKMGEGTGEPIVKTCPECETLHHPTVKICPFCGYEFEFTTRLETSSTDMEIITTGKAWYNVTSVLYCLNKGKSNPDSIKVSYVCGIKVFNEYWCLDHRGYARQRAYNIIKNRGDISASELSSCDTMLTAVNRLKKPVQVLVDTSKKFPEILKYKMQV